MLSLTKNTKLNQEEVIKKAEGFFGAGGLGLKTQEKDDCTIYLEGGGGGVRIITAKADKGTKVDLETREWESQAKDFMYLLK